MSVPVLSVIVPTYRRPGLLDRCLTALANSDLEAFEVIAIDDGSQDRTADVLRAHAVRLPLSALVQRQNAGPAAARNRGVAAAEAPLVLFLDDDVVVTPTLLRTHVHLHQQAEDPQLYILGRVAWHPDLKVTSFMRWLDQSGLQFAYETWLTEGRVDPPYAAFYTANLSIPTGLLRDAGGFDERFPFPAYEDMELAFRLSQTGLRMDYRSGALAYHARPIDLATFRRRMVMVARSAALLRRTAPDFPLDDAGLWQHDRSRRQRIRLAARAMIGDDSARAEHYWAQIGHAYVTASRTAREI